MTKKTFAILVALLTFIVGVALARFSLPRFRSSAPLPADKKELQLSNYRLSGPYQHENLTIYLIHGPNQTNSRMFTPLQEAMERNIVIVHETSEVNELSIENVSDSEEVFVQAGDVVKGGRQDRMLAVDLIVPAKSGEVPIAAFCVENSRWSQRGMETADHFTLTEMSANRDIRLAARQALDQVQVWRKVDETQEKLSGAVNAEVRSSASTTSLPLALENEKVQESAAAYVDKLSSIVGGSTDVIGFVFTIGNKLNSADVYASNAMFKRFWPRLLKSAAIEAVAERNASVTNEPVLIAAAGEFLVASERGTETLQEVTARTHMLKREAENSVLFETRDMAHDGSWIHRSYLTKF